MVVLLAQHLYLQNDIHYLVAPEQLLRIEVYDCPFIATALSLERSSAGVQRVEWGTNLGHRGRLGEQGSDMLLLPLPQSGELIPVVTLAGGLRARVSRNAYYDLIDWSTEIEQAGERIFSIESCGKRFETGRMPA